MCMEKARELVKEKSALGWSAEDIARDLMDIRKKGPSAWSIYRWLKGGTISNPYITRILERWGKNGKI